MSKKRVLIVDDEIDTLKLLKMIVEISGYEAYTTLNSLEALTLAQVEQPDVILLDIMMPKMDGFQLCKMMRANPHTNSLPVIFVTAYPALDLEDRRKACGADMVLPKPIDMDQLIKAIEQVQSMERIIPADIQKASGDNASATLHDQNKGATPPPAARTTPPTISSTPAAPASVEPPKPTATTTAPPAVSTANGASTAASTPAESDKAQETPKSTDSKPN
jgi:CheY-like chemotaxis protein